MEEGLEIYSTNAEHQEFEYYLALLCKAKYELGILNYSYVGEDKDKKIKDAREACDFAICKLREMYQTNIR